MGKPAPAPNPLDGYDETGVAIALDQIRALGEQGQTEAFRSKIVAELVRRQGLTEPEAKRVVRALFRQYQAQTGLK